MCAPCNPALFTKCCLTRIHVAATHSRKHPLSLLNCVLELLLVSQSFVDRHGTSFWSVTLKDSYAVGILECPGSPGCVSRNELHHAAFLEEVFSETACDISLGKSRQMRQGNL